MEVGSALPGGAVTLSSVKNYYGADFLLLNGGIFRFASK